MAGLCLASFYKNLFNLYNLYNPYNINMNLQGIVAVSGKPGLWKALAQNKTGFILESLDEKKTKLVANLSTAKLAALAAANDTAGFTSQLEEVNQACITCHVVEPTNVSPRVVAIGPNFQDVANTKGMTATALRVFLTTSHPKMPNLILTSEQIADVTAYIPELTRAPMNQRHRASRRHVQECLAYSGQWRSPGRSTQRAP